MSDTNYIERYWRDATPEDAIKELPMVARFRMYGDVPWTMGELHGTHTKDGRIWFDKRFCNSWTICQVYNAPDPGEGWRLIDTGNEKLHEGDEFLNKNGTWVRSLNKPSEGFAHGLIYRRRITPAVTYVPFTWEDREQLRGRWVVDEYGNEYQVTRFELHVTHGLYIDGASPQELLEKWKFLDTGKPVGKEVTSAN